MFGFLKLNWGRLNDYFEIQHLNFLISIPSGKIQLILTDTEV